MTGRVDLPAAETLPIQLSREPCLLLLTQIGFHTGNHSVGQLSRTLCCYYYLFRVLLVIPDSLGTLFASVCRPLSFLDCAQYGLSPPMPSESDPSQGYPSCSQWPSAQVGGKAGWCFVGPGRSPWCWASRQTASPGSGIFGTHYYHFPHLEV